MNKIFSKYVRSLLIVFASLIAFSIFSQPVEAQPHFVCGQVNNAVDGTSVAWRTVHVYYPGDPDNFKGCEISPENNRYCCDARDIPNHGWRAGDTINAEVPDFGDGYYAGPVSVVTTNNAYDIAPEMTLMYLVDVISPLDAWKYTTSSIELSVTTKTEYSSAIWYTLDTSDTVLLCNDCNTATSTLDVADGEHDLTVFASMSNGTEASKLINFAIDTSIPFKEVAPAPVVSVGVGGGGGSGGSGTGAAGDGSGRKFKEKYNTISPGKPVFFRIETDDYTGITELIVFVNKPVINAAITVEKLTGAPRGIFARAPAVIHSYSEVSTVNLHNFEIDKSIIKFRIDHPWFVENRYDKKSVVLLRYSEEERRWEELVTKSSSENEEFIFYEVETDGFSVFAIHVKRLEGGLLGELQLPWPGGYIRIRLSSIAISLLLIFAIVFLIVQRRKRK